MGEIGVFGVVTRNLLGRPYTTFEFHPLHLIPVLVEDLSEDDETDDIVLVVGLYHLFACPKCFIDEPSDGFLLS